MSDLMEKAWEACWGSMDGFPNPPEDYERIKRVVSLVIEEAAKVAVALKPEGGPKVLDPRRDHAIAIANSIRSLLNKGE